MTRINANTRVQTPPPEATQTPPNSQLMADIQTALVEMDQFRRDNGEWLTDEQIHNMDYLAMALSASMANIAADGVGGGNGAGGAGSGAEDIWEAGNLQPGWNGLPPGMPTTDDADAEAFFALHPEFGEYAGTAKNLTNSANPTKFVYQMTEGEESAVGKTFGKDMVLTITDADGNKKSYLIKNFTLNPGMFGISAKGIKKADGSGVTIDMSGVIQINDGSFGDEEFYKDQQISIYGSEGDDTLIGSQSRNQIIGAGGNDTIDGQAGDDEIYGDEKYIEAGAYNEEYGGDDDIKGGAGVDAIRAGGGFDTTYVSDRGEGISDVEDPDTVDASTGITVNSIQGSFSGTGWHATDLDEKGRIIIEPNANVTNLGTLTLKIPDGYSMALFERDPENNDNIIITYVGEAGEMKVKIKAPSDQVVRIDFQGNAADNIIDARIDEKNLVIKFTDTAGGRDIVLGPTNDLIASGVDVTNLKKSQGNSSSRISQTVSDGIFAPTPTEQEDYNSHKERYKGYIAEAGIGADAGVILIKKDTTAGAPPTAQIPLRLAAPKGYTKGYVTQDAAGNIYVIFVQPATSDGEAKTLVYKIDPAIIGGQPPHPLRPEDIHVYMPNADGEFSSQAFELVPVSSDAADYSIDMGAEADMIFHQGNGANVASTPEDIKIKLKKKEAEAE